MQDVKTAKVLFVDGEYEKAANMFFECARDGSAEAAFHYAYCLQHGYGVTKNSEQAVSFYKFAKEKIGEANYNLAVMYMHGEGVAVDYEKANAFMQDAARADVIEAQLYLGVAYTMGIMFEPDIIFISLIPYHTPISRTEFFELAGEVPDLEKDEDARVKAIRFDPNSAFLWFRRASKHDSTYVEELATQSKYLFARCFLDGLGTEFNRRRGENLMLVAAKDGSKDALMFLETEAPYRLPELEDDARLDSIRQIYRLGS